MVRRVLERRARAIGAAGFGLDVEFDVDDGQATQIDGVRQLWMTAAELDRGQSELKMGVSQVL